ncbi:hypothetical protein M0804_004376 [Polistes exclamans]|nr:hypothetical protein M0804_004376 [Polistes exclamans]
MLLNTNYRVIVLRRYVSRNYLLHKTSLCKKYVVGYMATYVFGKQMIGESAEGEERGGGEDGDGGDGDGGGGGGGEGGGGGGGEGGGGGL